MLNILLTVLVGVLIILGCYTHLNNLSTQPDSELKRRALLTSPEQMLYNRLHDILPNSHVMAHVSFDALLTTKFDRTRRKYQTMMADFVVLDRDYRILAVVGMSDGLHTRRQEQAIYQDQLLELAGYRVLRYVGVPEYQTLRQDFKPSVVAAQDQGLANLAHTAVRHHHKPFGMMANSG